MTVGLVLPTVLGQCWARAARPSVVAVVRVRISFQYKVLVCTVQSTSLRYTSSVLSTLQTSFSCRCMCAEACYMTAVLMPMICYIAHNCCALPAQVMEEATAR